VACLVVTETVFFIEILDVGRFVSIFRVYMSKRCPNSNVTNLQAS
jgi:hypothetical protein